ncbi:MAG: twin-arginine translocase subunit TatC [Myxococcota bacterium]
MSLGEHLTELRARLLRCTLSVLVLGTASLIFAKTLYGLLMRPVLMALPPESSALVYTSAIEEINVFMKVGIYCGVFLTTPVILWQLWGFVSPGLYAAERRLAGPFVVLGSLAFLGGLAFAYFVVLPGMFQFLLREESSVALEARLDAARLREQDALRFLRLGDLERAGKLAEKATDELSADGEGQASSAEGDMGVTLVPKRAVEVVARLEGLGRLVDASSQGLGGAARPVLAQVMDKRVEAIAAFEKRDLEKAETLVEEAARMLAGVAPEHTAELDHLWRLEKDLGLGKARYEALNWTRPMLSMQQQLTLVLVLLLAFGVIFELPLVMAVLGMAGLVKSKWLFKYQRHAFVVCLILAAIITPTGDVVNLSLMAGPMLACYELGVLAVWVIEKRRGKAQTAIAPVS